MDEVRQGIGRNGDQAWRRPELAGQQLHHGALVEREFLPFVHVAQDDRSPSPLDRAASGLGYPRGLRDLLSLR